MAFSHCNTNIDKSEEAGIKEFNFCASKYHRGALMKLQKLLDRLKLGNTRLPDVAGVFAGSGFTVCRVSGRHLFTEQFSTPGELLEYLDQVPQPRTVCAALNSSKEPGQLLDVLKKQLESVIITDPEEVWVRLQMDDPFADFKSCGFSLTESGENSKPALAALLAGWYYHAGEYEVTGKQHVLPLLPEEHELFSLLMKVPPGEVLTLNNVVRYLGFGWTRDRIGREIKRPGPGSRVPGHRLVEKNGGLPGFIPESVQRELLIAELVPFINEGRVDVKKAQWQRQKYKPLTNYLFYAGQKNWFFALGFREMEEITGSALPPAARKLGYWWQNEAEHAYIWKDAHCRVVDINIHLETVAFKSSHFEKTRG